jgi:hypothetical protein
MGDQATNPTMIPFEPGRVSVDFSMVGGKIVLL